MEIQGVDISELEMSNIGRWPSSVRYAMLVVSVILAFFLGYFFDLSDQAGYLTNVVTKREKLQQEYAQTEERISHIPDYQEQVNKLQANLARITQQLPQSNEEAGLLNDISQEAQKSGLQISSIKPIAVEPRDFYVEESIELRLVGNYHGFGEFVSNISNMQRIVTLHDFSIKAHRNAQNEPDPTGALEMVVTLKTYWAKPPGKKT